jgi:hypothetical protein
VPGCSWARGFTAAANEACSAWDGCASRWRHVCRTRHYSRSSGGRHFSRTSAAIIATVANHTSAAFQPRVEVARRLGQHFSRVRGTRPRGRRNAACAGAAGARVRVPGPSWATRWGRLERAGRGRHGPLVPFSPSAMGCCRFGCRGRASGRGPFGCPVRRVGGEMAAGAQNVCSHERHRPARGEYAVV